MDVTTQSYYEDIRSSRSSVTLNYMEPSTICRKLYIVGVVSKRIMIQARIQPQMLLLQMRVEAENATE